ncbi:MAG: hypothetical protein RL739_252 [Pseudomonadota bacterium]|jgi:hypothetical protein
MMVKGFSNIDAQHGQVAGGSKRIFPHLTTCAAPAVCIANPHWCTLHPFRLCAWVGSAGLARRIDQSIQNCIQFGGGATP